ncbi:hypothetical protein [Streptomyces sp. NPDC051776]|uniref:hypothetical protein n=1 Tax=Streptomyces sp. NPDC051776 TaxID=3155414 RepID=UPI00342E8B1E
MSATTVPDRYAMLTGLGLCWHPSGQAGLRGPLLALAEDCDRAFQRLAGIWRAQEERHPASLPAERLQRVDYLNSFPHQATFPVRMDPGHLDGFLESEMLGEAGEVRLGRLAPVSDVLTPAACYHLFSSHQDERLAAPLHLTTRNTCFRQETAYVPLRRQWSFSMREIVCIGSAQESAAFLEKAATVLSAFLSAMELPAEFLPATDPFFRPLQNPKFLMQRLQPTKHEATYGGDLAIASLNLHHDHFGTAFGIVRDGRPAHTACLAFGVERWLYAITDRHGADPSSWPCPGDAAETVRGSL